LHSNFFINNNNNNNNNNSNSNSTIETAEIAKSLVHTASNTAVTTALQVGAAKLTATTAAVTVSEVAASTAAIQLDLTAVVAESATFTESDANAMDNKISDIEGEVSLLDTNSSSNNKNMETNLTKSIENLSSTINQVPNKKRKLDGIDVEAVKIGATDVAVLEGKQINNNNVVYPIIDTAVQLRIDKLNLAVNSFNGHKTTLQLLRVIQSSVAAELLKEPRHQNVLLRIRREMDWTGYRPFYKELSQLLELDVFEMQALNVEDKAADRERFFHDFCNSYCVAYIHSISKENNSRRRTQR
jgi:hypothetical protein